MKGRSLLSKRIVLVFLTILILVNDPSIRISPWARDLHQQIARDALQNLPLELKNLLERNINRYLEGSIAPDTQFKDFVNHVWHVDENYGNAVDKIAEEVDLIIRMIRRNESESDTAFEFGALSHYITDLNNPLHTSGKDPEESDYHSKFEDYADSLLPIVYEFDGLENVTDVRERMRQTATWACQYYDTIKDVYKGGSSGSQKYCGSKNGDVYHYPSCKYVAQIKPENLIWFTDECGAQSKGYRPCKVCNPPACTGKPAEGQLKLNSIIQSCYSHAVNDVSDVFFTIWKASKRKLKSQITLVASKDLVQVGEDLVLSGVVNPRKTGLTISIYQSSTGLLFELTDYNLTTDASGQFSLVIRLESAGTIYMKASWAGDSEYEGNESNVIMIRCLKRKSSIAMSIDKASVVFNSSQIVSGKLDPLLDDAKIVITCVKPDGSTFNMISKTDANGKFDNTILTDAVGEWSVIASWDGNDYFEGSTSENITFQVVKIRPNIAISVSSDSITVGKPIQISGTISPEASSINLQITYIKPDGEQETRVATTYSNGVFQDSYVATVAGSWRVQASYSGDSIREEATSNMLTVSVNPATVDTTLVLRAITLVIAMVVLFLVIRHKAR